MNPLRYRPSHRLLPIAGLFLLLAGGCSSQPPVQGKVVYDDGAPVQGGSITFNSKEQKIAASGVIADDGTFALSYNGGKGAPAGHYSVVVVGKNDVYGAPPTVDEVYGSPLDTPLKQDVVAGANDLTITVKRPAVKPRR